MPWNPFLSKQRPNKFEYSYINQLTLAQLSSAAADLWSSIEHCEEDAELEKLLHQQLELQDLTESKVDAFCYVQEQLKIDLSAWTARLEAVSKLY